MSDDVPETPSTTRPGRDYRTSSKTDSMRSSNAAHWRTAFCVYAVTACRHEKLAAFSCKKRGFYPLYGARRIAESAAHLVDLIPQVPVRQWVVSFPTPLRVLFAAHPELLTPVLQVVHRVIATLLIKQSGLKRTELPQVL
jgi:hypothetical protein